MNTKSSIPAYLPLVNALAFVGVFTMNVLSNLLPFNGRTVGEISDLLTSYITPAGYTFSIWGLIYLSLLGYVVYQLLPNKRQAPFQAKIGWFFVASSIFNSGWLLAWHYGYYGLSIVLMVSLLISLIAIFRRLRIGRANPQRPWQTRLFVEFPFSIYLGWITVATIVNVASVVNFWGWDGFGIAEPVWSAIMIATAVLVAAWVLYNRMAISYAGVLIWALFGIRAAYPDVAVVANSTVAAAILIAAIALFGAWRSRQQQPASSTRTRTA